MQQGDTSAAMGQTTITARAMRKTDFCSDTYNSRLFAPFPQDAASIMIHRGLLAFSTTNGPYSYGQSTPCVHTSLASLRVDKDTDAETAHLMASRSIKIHGVVSKSIPYENGEPMSEELVVADSGLVYLVNTGKEEIPAGSMIFAAIPRACINHATGKGSEKLDDIKLHNPMFALETRALNFRMLNKEALDGVLGVDEMVTSTNAKRQMEVLFQLMLRMTVLKGKQTPADRAKTPKDRRDEFNIEYKRLRDATIQDLDDVERDWLFELIDKKPFMSSNVSEKLVEEIYRQTTYPADGSKNEFQTSVIHLLVSLGANWISPLFTGFVGVTNKNMEPGKGRMAHLNPTLYMEAIEKLRVL